MVISHALVGAAAGEMLNEPLVVFFLMVFFHLLMDKVPHFWPRGMRNGQAFASFDTALTVLFLVWVLIYQPENYVSVFAGALGGILVDVIFVGIPQVRKSKYGEWQNNRQPHSSKKISLISDLTAIILSVIILIVK